MSDGVMEPPPAEDDLDRALRELTEGNAGEAKFKELSAKERAKAAREQSNQARKRAKAWARQAPAPSAGWRGGYRYDLPARQLRKQGRRARRGRALKTTAWIAAIVVFAGAGLFAYQHLANERGGPNDAQVVTNGATPSSSRAQSPLSAADDGPPADPFASTPADHWADGPAGIVVPAAKAVGPFSASQVAEAYAATKKLLTAETLDHTTLLGGAPTAFANLLVPPQRSQFVAGLDKIGRDSSGALRSTRVWVTSFAPGTTVLIGTVIKVHGTMSAQASTSQGNPVLNINVNYRVVYPVEPPHAPQDWMRVVAELTGYVSFGDWQDSGGDFVPWVETDDAPAGIRCDAIDGFVHPEYPDSSPDKVRPSGNAIDPYSMKNQPATSGCQPTTGT
ncbi:MAG TPA: hypothetical protein VMU95_08480 [Trebonia sp.]|nr:hypothetical protein [Trebonia sp.]